MLSESEGVILSFSPLHTKASPRVHLTRWERSLMDPFEDRPVPRVRAQVCHSGSSSPFSLSFLFILLLSAVNQSCSFWTCSVAPRLYLRAPVSSELQTCLSSTLISTPLGCLERCPFQVIPTPFFQLLSHPAHLPSSHALRHIQQQILQSLPILRPRPSLLPPRCKMPSPHLDKCTDFSLISLPSTLPSAWKPQPTELMLHHFLSQRPSRRSLYWPVNQCGLQLPPPPFPLAMLTFSQFLEYKAHSLLRAFAFQVPFA